MTEPSVDLSIKNPETHPQEFIPINQLASLTPEQLNISPLPDSKEFSSWFKNSQVADEQGKPLVVYHGTSGNAVFTEFDLDKVEGGVHFGSLDQAKIAAKPKAINSVSQRARVLPCYLSIQQPLELKDLHSFNFNTLLQELFNQNVIKKDSFLSHKIRSFIDEVAMTIEEFANPQSQYYEKYDRKQNARLRNILLKLGFDGIIYENTFEGKGKSFIIFNSEQCKSVYNNGSFDQQNPNIYS